MKRSIIAAAALLSLTFSASAMAKDLDAIDLFAGDFAGVVNFDFDKLVANKMIDGAISKNINSSKDAEQILKDLKEAGIDYKKDIDTVAVAVNDNGHACAAIDAKKALNDAFTAIAKKDNMTSADYKGMVIYSDKDNSIVLLSDKRILTCENIIDIKPLIDNAKADKPKMLKDREPVIYKAYALTDSSADIRIAGKMTPAIKGYVQSYKLNDGKGNSIALTDAESAAVSVSVSKGLNVAVYATTKSDDKSKAGAAIINEQLSGILSDPSLNELGLGFVKDAVKVTADKKNIKATVKFTDEQMTLISALVAELTASAVPAKTSGKAAAHKK